ncbi:MAG TPA: type II secretion system F family protein [Tepidisphaeraceae bacterium]|nr:type II secretion system F family protein [Tepidisphaeraceae bacterium]
MLGPTIMPTYAYSARDSSGALVNGTIAAASVAEASQALRAEGRYPTAVNLTNDPDAASGGTGGGNTGVAAPNIKISRDDVIQFSTQLAIMVETGVTLSEALDCIASQTQRPNVKRLVEDVARQVQGGADFSASLARHPRSFPRLYVALIKASEKSGMMSKLLIRANTYLKDEAEILRKVKGALTYPGIMLAFATTTTIFLLAFVLPKFTSIYEGKGAALPMPTKVLMGMSGFLVGHWMALIAGLSTAGVLAYLYFTTEGGARVGHWIQINVPLLGKMYRKLHLARTLRMVGTMAGAGVNLVDAVQTAQDLCGNTYYRELWGKVSEQIQAGKQLSEPLFASPLVPRGISQMLHSGEKGGKLGMVMEQVSGYAEQELKEQIAELTRYIEPAMIIIMGLIIGGVALALLLPIFTMSRVVAS